MQSDAEYFRQRAREERQAASIAEKNWVHFRHLEFALAYELRVRLIEEESRLSAQLLEAV